MKPDIHAEYWIVLSSGAVWHAIGDEPQFGGRLQALCGTWLEPTDAARRRDDEPPEAEACDICHVVARHNYDPSAILRLNQKTQRGDLLTPEETQMQVAMMGSALSLLAWAGGALIEKIFKTNIITPEFREKVGELANDMMRRSRAVGRNQRRISAEHGGPTRRPRRRRKSSG